MYVHVVCVYACGVCMGALGVWVCGCGFARVCVRVHGLCMHGVCVCTVCVCTMIVCTRCAYTVCEGVRCVYVHGVYV